LTPPSIGQPNATEDVDIVNAFSAIQTLVNGNLDELNLAASTNQRLGLNGSGTVGRGKSVIATSEARANTVYGTLTTPDRVAGVVLPTDGLIAIAVQATWFESVAGAARAAIFLGANQLRVASAAGAAVVQEAQTGGTPSTAVPLHTFGGGLISENASGSSSDVTTGQVAGASTGTTQNGICYAFAAAGTYDVTIQFKASSGSVTAVNRRLWAWVVGF
jgi:hypothetical protein